MAQGEISGRRPLVEIPPQQGSPVGLAVDLQGNVWVALWGGGAVHCYDGQNGKLLDRIDVGVSLVTSCCFGGAKMDRLFITTAWSGMSAVDRREEPTAGGIFTCEPGVVGTAPVPLRLPNRVVADA